MSIDGDGEDPLELIEQSKSETEKYNEKARELLDEFLDGELSGGLYDREDVIKFIVDSTELDIEEASLVLSALIEDIVDPVQQVPIKDGRCVGIIEYEVWEDSGAYGYIDFNDRFGERQRIVCAKCVEDEEFDEDIAHATQGEGTASEDADSQQLLNKITSHYADEHQEAPSEIDIGASLVSGTTISGNTAWHDGNVSGGSNISIGSKSVSISPQGSGSGLNADQLDGNDSSDFATGGTIDVESPRDEQGNRSFDTTYTNNTGAPLVVYVNALISNNEAIAMYIDSLDVQRYAYEDSNYQIASVMGIVPPGSTYECDADNTPQLRDWYEQKLTA